MVSKQKLRERVDARKQELAAEENKLIVFREKVADFINDIKKRSAIYALVKNLSLWKELEKLVGD